MPWSERVGAVTMCRAGIVAPTSRLDRVLEETARAGVFEVDEADGSSTVDEVAAAAHRTEACAIVTGWIPRMELDGLRDRLAPEGGAVAELPVVRGTIPPTAHLDRAAAAAVRPLVSTYATVPYRDVDPVWFAAIAYVAMFGMMFGDVGHGAGLVVLGLVARGSTSPRLARLRPAVAFLLGAGAASVLFGFLYGEAFGPTGIVPTLWIRPLDEPEVLLVAGLVGGAFLLAATFVLAAANRWREGGMAFALYEPSGIAGALLFAGVAGIAGGVVADLSWLWTVGIAVAGAGAVLTFAGLLVHAGGGAAGAGQALVELFDTVLRLGSNVVSFTRLAAFGLTHAVITGVVWDGTVALWDADSAATAVAAVVLFVVGNLAAFGLGVLVAAIQALRLEYYEMFSRLFAAEGRSFRPWHPPVDQPAQPSESP